jgi:hypothetical protein
MYDPDAVKLLDENGWQEDFIKLPFGGYRNRRKNDFISYEEFRDHDLVVDRETVEEAKRQKGLAWLRSRVAS